MDMIHAIRLIRDGSGLSLLESKGLAERLAASGCLAPAQVHRESITISDIDRYVEARQHRKRADRQVDSAARSLTRAKRNLEAAHDEVDAQESNLRNLGVTF